MKCNSESHNRKSIRLKGYDYSKEGLYFITICTENRKSLFSEIVDNDIVGEHCMCPNNQKIVLNENGKIVEKEIIKTNEMRKNIKIEEYVIMPNHIHFIIEINDNYKTKDIKSVPTTEKFGKSTPNTIPTIVKLLKSSITKQINILRNREGDSVWQRNYYENIIRDEKQYIMVSEYIKNNPIKWKEDKYYNL